MEKGIMISVRVGRQVDWPRYGRCISRIKRFRLIEQCMDCRSDISVTPGKLHQGFLMPGDFFRKASQASQHCRGKGLARAALRQMLKPSGNFGRRPLW